MIKLSYSEYVVVVVICGEKWLWETWAIHEQTYANSAYANYFLDILEILGGDLWKIILVVYFKFFGWYYFVVV